MLKIVCALLVFAAVFAKQSAETPKHWAFIVAGSNGWMNYRHQADAYHAYQIMKKNGIPDERIIVMQYDDIAHNTQNPTPGTVINKPNGPNVYVDIPKDYTGEQVNPDNFLKVLTGDQEGLKANGLNGKVINSGPNDHIFVNFVDHGAPGLIAFPRSVLHATQLHSAILKMHKEKKYAKMVFYIEACESGSMFNNTLLPKDINVFATTAANPHESSYACYYDQKLGTYLGDVYSIKWMQDSDKGNLKTETLQQQFEIVKKETTTSHVQEYGDLTMGSLTLSEFQGGAGSSAVDKSNSNDACTDAVRSEDVPLAILFHRLSSAKTENDKDVYMKKMLLLEKNRESTVAMMKQIAAISVNYNFYKAKAMVTLRRDLIQHDCYELAVDALLRMCPGLNLPQNDYALRQLYILVNLCEEPTPVGKILEAIERVSLVSDLCNAE